MRSPLNEAELVALAMLSLSESVAAQAQALNAQYKGEMPLPYGGPYGFGPATTQLMYHFEPKEPAPPFKRCTVCGESEQNHDDTKCDMRYPTEEVKL